MTLVAKLRDGYSQQRILEVTNTGEVTATSVRILFNGEDIAKTDFSTGSVPTLSPNETFRARMYYNQARHHNLSMTWLENGEGKSHEEELIASPPGL